MLIYATRKSEVWERTKLLIPRAFTKKFGMDSGIGARVVIGVEVPQL